MKSFLRRGFAVLFAVLVPFAAIAQDQTKKPSKEVVDDNSSQKAEQLKLATEHIREMKFRRVTESNEDPVELIDRPLLTFGDPTRLNENGTLWAWGKQGRPLAMIELYRFQGDSRDWHAITLTSTDLVVVSGQPNWQWSPKQSAITPELMTKSDAPADNETIRLRQMKSIVGRFRAHEFWHPNNSRFELRLLVQPVHRYSQPSVKIHDGAVFVVANGTNPEILLLIEAIGESLQNSRWHFSAARLGSAEMHLFLDDVEVWTKPRPNPTVGQPTDPYWVFATPSLTPKTHGR